MKKNNEKPESKEKKEKKSLLDNRKFSALLSLVIALLIWSYVTTVKDPNQTGHIGDVPVDFHYASEIYKAKELDIVNNPEAKVTVHLKGDGSDVNSIQREDLIVYPDYSLLAGPGEVELPLLVRFADSRKGRDIEVNVGDTVNIVFDTVEEKSFEVEVELDRDKMTTAEGYVLHSVVPSPTKVTVRGPHNEVSRISRIVAVVRTGSGDMQSSLIGLSDSKIASATLEAWDVNDKPVELKYSVMDNTLADVSINVYQTRELPLKVNFINVSPNFDLDHLRYSLSHKTMNVTGKPSVIESLTELSVSDFDLGSSFAMDKAFQLNVDLPKGVVSKDNISTVTLSFDTAGLASRQLNVANIRVINQDGSLKITPMDKQVVNVTLIGPPEVLEKLSPASVVAVIDASLIQIAEGTENLPAQIQIPSADDVFAVGSYSVECRISVDGGES